MTFEDIFDKLSCLHRINVFCHNESPKASPLLYSSFFWYHGDKGDDDDDDDDKDHMRFLLIHLGKVEGEKPV